MHVLLCLDYLHFFFSLDPVTTAFYLACFDPKLEHVLHQTMVCGTPVPTDIDCLEQRF
jgi:hypothetical protein